MDPNSGWTKRGELIAPNNYVYFFLFLYFVAHLAMMHYNQHQMSKLDIKGKKEYAIMTFITVYFTYLVVVPSLWFSYKNQDKIIWFTVIIGSVLNFVYFIYTINFITKSLKKGVSKEQDKQRGFCIGSMLMTVFGFIILALVLFTRFSRTRELKQRLEDMKPDNYRALIEAWFHEFYDISKKNTNMREKFDYLYEVAKESNYEDPYPYFIHTFSEENLNETEIMIKSYCSLEPENLNNCHRRLDDLIAIKNQMKNINSYQVR